MCLFLFIYFNGVRCKLHIIIVFIAMALMCYCSYVTVTLICSPGTDEHAIQFHVCQSEEHMSTVLCGG